MQPATTYGTGEKVILSVEDDPAAFLLLHIGFQEVGGNLELYRVMNGEEGLAFLQRTGSYQHAPKPDLVLLNLNLPRLSGFDVLQAIKNDPALSAIPVVVFSSSDLDHGKARCLALGARSFVTKPADIEDFLAELRSVCILVASNPGSALGTS